MRHWHLERGTQGIAWLTFDQAGSTVNTLGSETLAELEQAVAACAADPPVGLLIRSGKTAGFCAGADLHAFAGLTDQAAAAALIRHAQSILDRLEGLPCPSLALIQGHCLGGGLELALACTYRLAADEPATRLGFPEVQVGIFPGFGGTLRAPRTMGHLAALRLMLDGRPISARAALELGLIDARVAPRLLNAAALDLIARRPPRHRPPLRERAMAWPGVRPLVAARLRRQVDRHADPSHYPAPRALIDHLARHAPNAQGLLAGEAGTVPRLLADATAQGLVRIFLLREGLRAAGGGDRPDTGPETGPEVASGTVPEIRHLHLIGAGVMGGDIAAWAALRGLRVSLQDRRPEDLTRALQRAEDLFRRKLRDPLAARAAQDRLIPDARGEGLSRADLVLEAIVEDAGAKRALFAAIEPRLKPGAWLATNTSSIPLETLAEGLARPERLVGLHFFNPVARMPLIEVVRGARTEAAALAAARHLARRLDKLPLVVKSGPGFLVNRILMPYLLEAVTLVDEGVPPERVDRAATAYGMPVGPVELADSVGLDICLAVARGLAGPTGDPPPASLLRQVESGRLGRKSGQGYYRWEAGRVLRPRFARVGPCDPEHQDRLVLRLLNEAVACLREGVVASADALDAGLVFGAGFPPFRGGPLHDLRRAGPEDSLARLQALHQRLGERFRPDPGWASLRGEQPC